MTFKVLNIHGKEIVQAETFKNACDIGMLLDRDFLIKEGNRKAEVMDIAFRRWHKWWNEKIKKGKECQ